MRVTRTRTNTILEAMMEGRAGGYTRITKRGRRPSDSSEMCMLAWVSEKVEPKTEVPVSEAAV